MESSNLYHHQLQEQCFGYGLSSLLDWNPIVSIDEDDEYYKPHLDGLMFPVLSPSSSAAADAIPAAIEQQYYHQHENYSDQTGISMSSSQFSCNIIPVNSDYVVKREQHNSFDLNHNVFLGRQIPAAARFGSMNNSSNNSPPRPPSLVSSISAAYTDDGGGIIRCSQFPGNNNTTSYFGFGNIHEAIHSPSSSSNKVSKAKRVSGAAMASHQQSKKPRTGSQRSSCPVLKVRKEKLGDRIAGLQRLVAPFGKTDTASVLTEAIGYIHFLHDQIQALNLPYMKSSGDDSHHPHRTSRVVQALNMKNEEGKTTLDLKSRGLCLVPLSLTSYISSCQMPMNIYGHN
ncbi:PREDICTED: transcription factor bHLH68-like [Ipomoea nil]|uniref:transcription factor bHLH68-like n=1 Tax=Ipomoea nil TaxID=35883 RepID=UPI00090179BF|nr:PREDICTED: transcription factor bHLH68-like [Ipomoea nil]